MSECSSFLYNEQVDSLSRFPLIRLDGGVQGGAAHAVFLGQGGLALCGGALANRCDLVGAQLSRAAHVLAIGARAGLSLDAALINHGQFERGHGAQHGQQHLIHSVGFVAGEREAFLFERDAHALVRQLFDQRQEVSGIARQATDFVDQHGVAFADVRQHRLERGAVSIAAAAFVFENFIKRQAVELARRVLADA